MDLRNVSCLTWTSSHHWESDGIRQKPEPLDNWIRWLSSAVQNAHTKRWIAYEHWKQFSAHTKWVVFCIVHCLMLSAMLIYNIELDWIEEYQWVDPPRLWEAVSVKKQDGSLLFFYHVFWLARMVLLLYSCPALRYIGWLKKTHWLLKSYHLNIF